MTARARDDRGARRPESRSAGVGDLDVRDLDYNGFADACNRETLDGLFTAGEHDNAGLGSVDLFGFGGLRALSFFGIRLFGKLKDEDLLASRVVITLDAGDIFIFVRIYRLQFAETRANRSAFSDSDLMLLRDLLALECEQNVGMGTDEHGTDPDFSDDRIVGGVIAEFFAWFRFLTIG